MKSAGCFGGIDKSSGRGRLGDWQVTACRQGTSIGGDGNFGEGRRENGGMGKESWSAGRIRAEKRKFADRGIGRRGRRKGDL